MHLLITESPAKAKKIQTFLTNEYTVKSSCGHITDLEKKKLEYFDLFPIHNLLFQY